MWLADVEVVHGHNGGSMTGDGSRKLLLHSTEGSSIEGAIAAYRGHGAWPHLTVDCRRRRVVQHLPLDVAARALRNAAGGEQTNREGTICVQVELVGTATDPESIGTVKDLAWLGSEVVAPVADLTGVPLQSSVTWAEYPGSYGLDASQRLSASAWDAYSGVIGHMHAPENTHGDPGALDVDRIITAAREDDMDFETARRAAQLGTGDALSEEGHRAYQGVLDAVRTGVKQQLNAALKSDTTPVGSKMAQLIAESVDLGELADAVVARLPEGSIDRETVEAGVRAVLAEGVDTE